MNDTKLQDCMKRMREKYAALKAEQPRIKTLPANFEEKLRRREPNERNKAQPMTRLKLSVFGDPRLTYVRTPSPIHEPQQLLSGEPAAMHDFEQDPIDALEHVDEEIKSRAIQRRGYKSRLQVYANRSPSNQLKNDCIKTFLEADAGKKAKDRSVLHNTMNDTKLQDCMKRMREKYAALNAAKPRIKTLPANFEETLRRREPNERIKTQPMRRLKLSVFGDPRLTYTRTPSPVHEPAAMHDFEQDPIDALEHVDEEIKSRAIQRRGYKSRLKVYDRMNKFLEADAHKKAKGRSVLHNTMNDTKLQDCMKRMREKYAALDAEKPRIKTLPANFEEKSRRREPNERIKAQPMKRRKLSVFGDPRLTSPSPIHEPAAIHNFEQDPIDALEHIDEELKSRANQRRGYKSRLKVYANRSPSNQLKNDRMNKFLEVDADKKAKGRSVLCSMR